MRRFAILFSAVAALGLPPGAAAQEYGPPPGCDPGTICVYDVRVMEGNSGTTQAVYTVTAPASLSALTVDWTTMDEGNATPNVDYMRTSGQVTIPAGATTASFSVPVHGDTATEPDEIFWVHLASASAGTISKHHGQGTIANDDGAVTLPDTTPPNTVIHGGPKGTTTKRRASFHLMSSEAGSKFQCKLDTRPWRACTASKTYRNLKKGRHTFRARAIDAAGNKDPTPAKRVWRIR